MSEWQKVRLGDVCSFQNGFAFKSADFNVNGDHYVVKIKELKDGQVKLFEDSSKVVFHNSFQKYIIDNNDVLVALTGDPVNKTNPLSWVGRVAINKTNHKILLNQRVAKFSPQRNHLNSKFIYYYFRVFDNFYDLAQKATGSASQANISTKTIEDTILVLPPLVEQIRISKILGALDDKIELNNRINCNLEAQAQTLFKRWVVDFEFPDQNGQPYKSSGGEMKESELGEIPKGWSVGNLTEIANYLNGLAMQKFRPATNEVGIPVLKIKELGNKKCDISSDLCSENIKPEYIVENGDVIFSWSGTLMVDIWCGGKCGLNQHLFKVTSDDYAKWFYYFWTDYHLHKFIRIAKDKAVTMGHIKREDLNSSEVIIPDSNSLQRMNAIMQPLLNKIIRTNLESNTLAQLRNSLLPKLMSNQISVEMK